MADRNLNQGQQPHQEWDRDKDKNRLNQDNDWSSGNYGGHQNRDMNQGYRDVGYSGDSAHGMDYGNQGSQNRASYIPDNDDNRSYGNRDYDNTQFGSSGTQGYRASGMDSNSGGYRSENRGSFGNAGYGNDYGNQDWNRNRNSGNQYGNDNDWNRGQRHQNTGGSWSSDHGWQDHNRSNMNYGSGNDSQRDYGNRGYGGGYGNMRADYGRSDWDRNRTKNRYGGDTSNHGNANQGGVDNNWWEKTKDKVSSWFSDDDDRDDRRRREYGSHRGKGPSDYRRSQDRIREDICDRLTDDDRVDASNIRIQIEDDVVILSGAVNSREEKRRAEDLVESVSGVHNVENRLRVGGGGLANREYTGNTENTGGIGNESGTTNEIIRNVKNDRESGATRTGTSNT